MKRSPCAVLAALVATAIVGCGSDDAPPSAGAAAPPQAPAGRPVSAASVQTAQKPAVPPPGLELRLAPGQRFPVRKVVEQTLTQQSHPQPVVGRTRLELWLMLAVEETEASDRVRMRLEYQRVHYRHDVPGESFEFDSSNAGPSLPPVAAPYLGLVGNGFAFSIGPDRRIVELAGFPEFLDRCVRDVPAAQRAAVLQQFSQLVDAAEIANVVDDGIGFLPAAGQGEPRIGSTWTRERRLGRMLPLHLTCQCTLSDLNEQSAGIDIAGHVAATAVIEPVSGQPPGDVRISVRGGHATGHCTVDRLTGLPLRSMIERRVEMLVEPAEGAPFVQVKHLLTTIECFPEQPAPRTALLRRAGPEPIDLDAPHSAARAADRR
jgi:hypothetical protein